MKNILPEITAGELCEMDAQTFQAYQTGPHLSEKTYVEFWDGTWGFADFLVAVEGTERPVAFWVGEGRFMAEWAATSRPDDKNPDTGARISAPLFS